MKNIYGKIGIRFVFLGIVLVLGITGCARQENTSPTQTMTVIQALPSATPSPLPPTPTDTQPPPSSTPTVAPTATATATETPTEVLPSPTQAQLTEAPPTPTAPATSKVEPYQPVANPVKIFLIKRDTGGPLCGADLVAVGTDVARTNSVVKDVTAALTRLFALKSEYVGSLYNPVHMTNFQVKSVTLTAGDFLHILLGGTLKRTKDECENTWLHAQIWSTFQQTKKTSRYEIYLDKMALGDLINNDR